MINGTWKAPVLQRNFFTFLPFSPSLILPALTKLGFPLTRILSWSGDCLFISAHASLKYSGPGVRVDSPPHLQYCFPSIIFRAFSDALNLPLRLASNCASLFSCPLLQHCASLQAELQAFTGATSLQHHLLVGASHGRCHWHLGQGILFALCRIFIILPSSKC